jgi:hypothetical protein
MAVAVRINDVFEKLSDDRKGIVYRLVLDMLSAQQTEDFDNYSQDDIQAITEARNRIANGDCLSFSSVDGMATHFGIKL